jgi:hypothetical protein
MHPAPSTVPTDRGRTSRPPVERAGEPTITELVNELRQESSELLSKEIELARLEIANAIGRLQTGISSMATGGMVAFSGFLFLLAAGAFGLDLVLETPWLSTLIVGAVAILLGAALLVVGKSRLEHLTPKRSLRSLRKDGELVKEHLPGGGS